MSYVLVYIPIQSNTHHIMIQHSTASHLSYLIVPTTHPSWLMNPTLFCVRSSPQTKYFARHVHRSSFSITKLSLPRHAMTGQSKYDVCHSDTQTDSSLQLLKVSEILLMNLPAPNVKRLKFSKPNFLSSLVMCLTLLSLTQKTVTNRALFRANDFQYQPLSEAMVLFRTTFSPKRNL